MKNKKRLRGAAEWLAEVGTFKCERRDCPKPKDQPCPNCGMPEVTPEINEYLLLFSQVKAFSALPCAGGLLDQPAALMESLDAIQSGVDAVQAKKAEEQRREQENARMLGGLSGSRSHH